MLGTVIAVQMEPKEVHAFIHGATIFAAAVLAGQDEQAAIMMISLRGIEADVPGTAMKAMELMKASAIDRAADHG